MQISKMINKLAKEQKQKEMEERNKDKKNEGNKLQQKIGNLSK